MSQATHMHANLAARQAACIPSHSCVLHARTHACTRARVHAHTRTTNTRTHTRMHACMHVWKEGCLQTNKDGCLQTNMRRHMYKHKETHVQERQAWRRGWRAAATSRMSSFTRTRFSTPLSFLAHALSRVTRIKHGIKSTQFLTTALLIAHASIILVLDSLLASYFCMYAWMRAGDSAGRRGVCGNTCLRAVPLRLGPFWSRF